MVLKIFLRYGVIPEDGNSTETCQILNTQVTRELYFLAISSHLTGVQGSNVSPSMLEEVTAIMWNIPKLMKNMELDLVHKISNIYKILNSNTANYHKNVACATANFTFLYQ
jgi:hypothetical protein